MDNPTIKPMVAPFKKFCMSIGALPTSYKDSLDYYETLLWLIKYLENVVIPVVNNNGEAVTELQNLYIELKNYVEHYFDNLDVQEEINNKLDNMVEQGTLQEIIADYLNSKAIFGFDNVASMKNSTNLIDGSYARTLGYHSINDGGGSLYKIRTITNIDVVDEMFIIALENNTLVAELILEEPKKINVLQVGIKRNVNENQSTKVQLLFNLDSKYTIYFPSGKYYFTSSLINSNRHDIIGDTNTVTDYDTDINGTRFYFTNLEDNTILLDCSSGSRCSIRDIYIICDNVEITLDKSLISDGTNPVDIFSKNKIYDNITGIKLGNFGNQVINVAIIGCNLGIYMNTYNSLINVGILSCETGINTRYDNVLTDINIQRCETGIILDGALNNLSQIRMDSIRYYGLEILQNSNNITNYIADFCQYAGIKISSDGNYINGDIGRSGTYYANFNPSNDVDGSKACKIYIRTGKNNNINIMASKTNALDNPSNYRNIPTYVITSGISGVTNYFNNITITGQIFDTDISMNTLLTIEQLSRLYHLENGNYSGNVTFEGITYIITPTNSLNMYNVYVNKPIRYDMDPAVLNASSNLDMQGHKITGVNELLFGNSSDGWISISKNSSSGDLKIQNVDTLYNRTNAEIRGVATPTANDSAVNKQYVDGN